MTHAPPATHDKKMHPNIDLRANLGRMLDQTHTIKSIPLASSLSAATTPK
jgi:hypothetical protein